MGSVLKKILFKEKMSRVLQKEEKNLIKSTKIK